VKIAQIYLENWTSRDQAAHDAQRSVAEKCRDHSSGFELESFRVTGSCRYKRGDIVLQVTDEGRGAVFVAPPGNVVHVGTRRRGNRQVSFVYIERPARRRMRVNTVARALGRGVRTRLRRNGLIRDADFTQSLLKLWA
jgi:hypothetical protein